MGTTLSDRSLKRYKAKGKKTGYIRIWKVVERGSKRYISDSEKYEYKTGFNHASLDAWGEDVLIHAFRSETGYIFDWSLNTEYECLIECLIKPNWVAAISKNTLTTKAIVIPKYPKRKVTVREFRAAIKGKKVKKYSWEK